MDYQYILIVVLLACLYWVGHHVYLTMSMSEVLKTDAPFDELVNTLTPEFLTIGWSVKGQCEDLVIYYYERAPSIMAAIFLFFVGIIPGFLYLFLGGKTSLFTVSSIAEGKIKLHGTRRMVREVKKELIN